VGLSDAESQPAVVAARFRRLRQAEQQINLVARAARQRMKKLLEILEKHHEVLPETLRYLAEDIRQRATALEPFMLQLLAATHPGAPKENPLRWRRPKEVHERFNVRQQTLIWWEYWLHQGRGPRGKIWDDIYALAKVWRLTECRDVDSFKRIVVRLTQGMTEIVAPPAWCLKGCQLRN